MSQVSMSVTTFKEVAIKMPPRVSILLRANHGLGKSKAVRQVSSTVRALLLDKKVINDKSAYPVIDRRLSQMSDGDMVGLPSTDGETTRFNPPDWFKRACNEPCALFLDELNRATPEVMQAAFQIILDRELNGHKLHPETRVYAAVNAGAAYTVNEMDPALLDRFFVIDLNPSLEEFCKWARNNDPEQGGNLHECIPAFIEGTTKSDGSTWLLPPKNAAPGDVCPSPRSWEMVNNALMFANIIDDPSHPLFYHMTIGFVGVEASIAFQDFCKNFDNRVKGEDLVNKYHEPAVRAKVQRLNQQSRHLEVAERVADYVVKNLSVLNDQQGKNVATLMGDLNDEVRIRLWSLLTVDGTNKLELLKSVHTHCAKLILDVFAVPMGKAGIGVVPNIPSLFGNNDSNKKSNAKTTS